MRGVEVEEGVSDFSGAELVALAEECGAAAAAMIDVASIVFEPEFRVLCQENRCGNYNRNWRCPPKAGDIHDLINSLKVKTTAMVFSHVVALKSSYDWKGMTAGGISFSRVCQKMVERIPKVFSGAVVLGAGPCKICQTCALLTEEPCRKPNLSVTSLEACGIDVALLAKLSGLKYNAGPSTITYFGAVLI
jgi:predicted metal-binding protein